MHAMNSSTHVRDHARKVISSSDDRLKIVAVRTRDKALDLAANLVDFQKSTFDGTAKVVGSLQDQTEKMLLDLVDKSGWMPKEAKKVMGEWVKLSQRSRAEFTRTMDKSFVLMTSYLKRVHEHEEAEKPKEKMTAKPKRSPGKKRVRTKKASA
jgi:polyhydroxyalkanoate synthesis regulator phasin